MRARALAVSQRWHLTAKVGELGYNILVLDTDIAIHSDPYPHLKVIHGFLTLPQRLFLALFRAEVVGWRACSCTQPGFLGFHLELSQMSVDVQGEVMGRHNLVLQSEGGQFPSINVGLVYLQNVQRGSAALWIIQEVRSAIPKPTSTLTLRT
jgi:hypothetical protein